MKRTKILIALLFCILMCLSLECALAAQSGYFYYTDHGDGTCTITDYAGASIAPSFPSTLNSLTVTGIGENVFRLASCSQSYKGIKGVTIPDTVTSIAANAFANCSNMETVTMGSGVQTIGENAFQGCSSLSSIVLPESVTVIGKNAFQNCSALRTVYAGSLENWLSIDFGNLSSLPMKYDLYLNDVLAENIQIPEDTETIAPYVFYYCSSLKSVTIPESVTAIGNYAFGNCASLETLYATTLENWLNISWGPTYYQQWNGYNLYLNGVLATDVTVPADLTAIGNYAFSNCKSLTSVTIPDAVSSVGESAFAYCSSLSEITIQGTAPDVFGDDLIFADVQATVTYQPGDSWNNKIQHYGGTLTWERFGETLDGDVAWYLSDDYSLHITGTGEMTSDLWDTWTRGDYKNKVAHIYVADTLSYVNVNWLDTDTFPNLQSVHFGAACHDTRNADFENVDIYYSGSVTDTISWNCKVGGTLTISGSGAMPDYTDFGAPWYKLGTRKQILNILVGEDITRVGSCAFYSSSAASVHLPSTLTELGHDAFYGAALTSVIIPDGVTVIPKSCFSGNYSLSSVKLPETLKRLDAYAFSNAPIEHLILPEGLEKIGTSAFFMAEITKLTFPQTVHTIEDFAFQNCASLADVTIPHTVTVIGRSAFDHCSETLVLSLHADSAAEAYAAEYGLQTSVAPHTEAILPGFEPTCTTPGLQDALFCDTCGVMLTEQTEIPPLGHTELVIPGYEATRTEPGLSDGKICTVCDQVLVAQEVLPVWYSYTDTANGMVDVVLSANITSDVYAQLLTDIGSSSINTLTIAESGVLNCPDVLINAVRVENHGQLLGGNLRNAILHNYGIVDGECTLYDLINYEGASISGDTEREDGETYYLTYLCGEIENYGTISYVGFSGASVKLNEGTIRVRVTYNDGWDWDDGWGWDSTTEYFNYGDRVGDVLGEGFYTSSGEYAADMTLGLRNNLDHHWTRQSSDRIYVKASRASSPVLITAEMAGDATSIYVAMGKLMTDELDIPVVLSNVECEDGTHYYESSLGGGTFTDVTFEEMATATDCTINGVITLRAAGDLRSSVTFGPDARIVVDGTTPNFTNIWGNHSYPFTYTLPVTITQNGVASNCTYTNTVVNNGQIASGNFSGHVENNGTITGGSFTGGLSGEGMIAPVFTLSANHVDFGASIRASSNVHVDGSTWEWGFALSETDEGETVEGASSAVYQHELLQAGYVYPIQVIPVDTGFVRAPGTRVSALVPDFTIAPIDRYTATLLRCSLQAEEITVPSYINNYRIASIASGAFVSCSPTATITYPVSKEAPADAFLPTQHVWRITGSQLYSYRGPATELTLSDSITTLSSDAFRSNTTLVSISGPAVKTIGSYAFAGCTNLVSFDFASVTTISSYAFSGCESLGDVYLPMSLTSIGSNAFPASTVIYSPATAYARTWANTNGYEWKHDQHTSDVLAAVEPTCTLPGLTEGLWCEGCGEIFTAQETIAALGHSTVADEAVAPSCAEPGLTEGSHCETCGEVLIAQESVPALGHTEAVIPGFEATCTEPGLMDYIFCEICDAVLQNADEIPALGHTEEISLEAIAPTCTEPGRTAEYACAVCGEVLTASQSLAAQGHTEYESIGALEPDCVNPGHTSEIICAVCSTTLVPSEAIPALGHTPVTDEAIAPDCVTDGLTEGSHCDVCGEVLVAQEVVNMLGHSPVTDAAVEPTDRETGLTEGRHCDVCGEVLVAQQVIPANYDWDGDVIVGYNRTNPIVVIPEDAVGLGDTAFKNKTFITSITIGDNVLTLGAQTFMGCTGLKDVYLPDHFTDIGEETFLGVKARIHCSAESATAVALGFRDIPFTTEDGWTLLYRVASLTGTPSAAWIVEYLGDETALTIPDTFGDAPVTQILADAFAQNSALTSVAVPDTVTLFGDRAFQNCTALSSINFPAALETIGNYAFENTAITSAALPSGLTEAGVGAFAGCKSLASATLPNGLTAVADHLFDGCAKLTGVKLPQSITSIGEYAFRGCARQGSMAIPASVTTIGKGAFYGCTRLSSVTLPDGLTEVADELFAYCSALKGVTLPSSVTEIGENAFFMCENLTSMVLPEGVTTIGSGAFKGCTALATLVLPDSLTALGDGVLAYCSALGKLVLPDGITSVGSNLCSNNGPTIYCNEGTSTANTLTAAGYSYNPLLTFRTEERADGTVDLILTGCADFLKEVVVPEGVTKIADYVFQNHANLEKITLPSTLKSIGNSAFSSCTALTAIELPEDLETIGANAFRFCSSLLAIDIPDGVYTIGENAFDSCTALESAKLSSALYVLEQAIFASCSNLKNVEIPYGVESIERRAFASCSALKTLIIPESVTFIGDSAFLLCDFETLYLPEGIVSIGTAVLNNHDVIYVPSLRCATTASIVAADVNRVFRLTGDDTLAYMASPTEDGDLFIRVRAASTEITELVIPEGVNATANSSAFANLKQLTKVVIPSTLTLIDASAFDNCTALEEIVISENVTEIGAAAFARCTALEEIVIPGTVTKLGHNLFSGCTSLKNATIENGVTTLASSVFNQCSALESVNIPDSVTSFGSYMFEKCTALVSVRLPQNLTTLPSGTFLDCASLATVDIPEGVTAIEDWAFKNCVMLENVTIPERVTLIGSSAFYGCTALESLTIPAGVTSIGGSAFYNCSNLSNLRLPANVSHVGSLAFYANAAYPILPEANCLTAFTLCSSNSNTRYRVEGSEQVYLRAETAENDAVVIAVVKSDSNITEALIPDGVTTISENAFRLCTQLVSVELPDSVVSIGSSAFYNCTSLESLTLPSSVTTLGKNVFTSDLKTLYLPDGITSLYDSSLRDVEGVYVSSFDCETAKAIIAVLPERKLRLHGDDTLEYGITYHEDGTRSIQVKSASKDVTEVVIPDSVTAIADYAFSDCTKLVSVELPDSITSIGNYAFLSCSQLTSIALPNELPTIGNGVFKYCAQLTSIVLPEKVTAIGEYAFSDCTQLTSIVLPETVTTIGKSAFSNCSALTALTVPTNVTSIGERAFQGCEALTELRLPANVAEMGAKPVSSGVRPILPEADCLTAFTFSAAHSTNRYVVEGCEQVYLRAEKDEGGNAAIVTVMGADSAITSAVIPQGVTAIANMAFHSHDKLVSVDLPEGLTSIGSQAFSTCPALESITFPQSLTHIGNYAFNGTNLRSFRLPGTVESFGTSPFNSIEVILPSYNCQTAFRLSAASLNYTVDGLEDYGFRAYEDENGVQTFSLQNLNSELAHIVVPDWVTAIASFGSNGAGVQTVFIPDSVENINTSAFTNCRSCTVISSHEAYARTWAKANSIAWQHDAPIPVYGITPATRSTDGMTRHEYCSGCGELLTAGAAIDHHRVLFLPAAIRTIETEAFAGSNAMQITLPDGTQSIGSKAFAGCNDLLLVVIPANVSSIADDALEGCSGVCVLVDAANDYVINWAQRNGVDCFIQ